MCGNCKKYASELMGKKLENLNKQRKTAQNKFNSYL